jgi:hypothetical protein
MLALQPDNVELMRESLHVDAIQCFVITVQIGGGVGGIKVYSALIVCRCKPVSTQHRVPGVCLQVVPSLPAGAGKVEVNEQIDEQAVIKRGRLSVAGRGRTSRVHGEREDKAG